MTALIWGTKDVIPETVRGRDYTQLMHISDWFPTLLSAAGIDVGTLGINYTFDGVDHWQGILGNVSTDDALFAIRHNLYYGYDVQPLFGNIAFRNGWMKVLNGSGGDPRSWYRPPEMTGNAVVDVVDVEGYVSVEPYPLYDLETDPNEYTDIAQNNSALVEQLLDEMVAIKNTGVPQTEGETGCPNQTFPVYPIVGKVWWPWCG